ncbi:hypothetical protein Droror1_Dr00006517 [Drosera rotundifolia]
MAAPSMSAPSRAPTMAATETFVDTKRKDDIRHQNILAGCGVADAVRTGLGPNSIRQSHHHQRRRHHPQQDGSLSTRRQDAHGTVQESGCCCRGRDDNGGCNHESVSEEVCGFRLRLMRLRFRLSKLYSARGLSLKADALRSCASSVDVDDDLVSSSSRGGGGGLDDEDPKARVSCDVDRPRNGAAGDSEGVDGCSCLPCGHMYGMSCIKKWLRKQKSSGKCPQCEKKCTLKDIRRMYGSRVVVIDEQSNKRICFLEAKCDAFEKKVRVVAMWLVIDTIPLACRWMNE